MVKSKDQLKFFSKKELAQYTGYTKSVKHAIHDDLIAQAIEMLQHHGILPKEEELQETITTTAVAEYFICNTNQFIALINRLQSDHGKCICKRELVMAGQTDHNLRRSVTFQCPDETCAHREK